MLGINKAKYLADYRIHLFFNNKKEGVADLKETIFGDDRQIFSDLKQKSLFADFIVEHNTVVWSNELDLAPEYLFYLSFMDDDEFQEQFKQWGYIG